MSTVNLIIPFYIRHSRSFIPDEVYLNTYCVKLQLNDHKNNRATQWGKTKICSKQFISQWELKD